MSRIGGTIITVIAEALAVPIRKGHRIALLGGALVGAIVGALAGLINSSLDGSPGGVGRPARAAVAGMLPFPGRPARSL